MIFVPQRKQLHKDTGSAPLGSGLAPRLPLHVSFLGTSVGGAAFCLCNPILSRSVSVSRVSASHPLLHASLLANLFFTVLLELFFIFSTSLNGERVRGRIESQPRCCSEFISLRSSAAADSGSSFVQGFKLTRANFRHRSSLGQPPSSTSSPSRRTSLSLDDLLRVHSLRFR